MTGNVALVPSIELEIRRRFIPRVSSLPEISARSARGFQFAEVLGTRTLAEGPLFLIGDFQKLHPQPSSLGGQ